MANASGINASGLASGIDTKGLIDQLIYAERATARIAERSKATAQARLDAIKTMNTKLLSLRDTMDVVEQSSAFSARKATSSNDTVLTATATTSAMAGSMTLNVKSLASAHQVAAAAQPNTTDPQGTTGSITIRAAGATSDTIVTVTDYSLTGIASAINEADAGVSAAVINDGSGYRLLVTSTKSGLDNGITTLTGDGDLATLLPGVGGLTEVAAAGNAVIRIGDPITGLKIENATNLLDQAIPGLTLTLKAVGDGINLTVNQDSDSVRGSMQKMVDALNEARSYLTTNSKYDTTTKQAGSLFSEYDLARQLDSVENELTKTYDTQPTGFQSLADIGITFGTDGKFTIDAAIFDAKLSENQSAVAALSLAAGSAASVPLEGLTRSIDGSMALKQSYLEDSIKAFDDRIASLDARLEQRRKFYEAQFLQMEKLTAQFQSQGTSITNFVNGLTSYKK